MQLDYKKDKILFRINKNGKVYDESPAITHNIGYSIKGKEFDAFLEYDGQKDNKKCKKNDVKNKYYEHWKGEIQIIDIEGDFKWYNVNIIPITAEKLQYSLVIGSDITQEKEDKIIAEESIREEMTDKIKQQEYRSNLILEGEEKERERVAREIHDGIGQMLTALNLGLEAISDDKHNLNNVKKLTKTLIQETRRLSFNLSPTNLADYGLIPAINKFCNYANKIKAVKISFKHNKTEEFRLNKEKELHVYRIVQEFVNNAVKHSHAKNIEVEIKKNDKTVTITVTDDGDGFAWNEKRFQNDEYGFGLSNIKKRCTLINAEYEFITKTGNGTKMIILIKT